MLKFLAMLECIVHVASIGCAGIENGIVRPIERPKDQSSHLPSPSLKTVLNTVPRYYQSRPSPRVPPPSDSSLGLPPIGRECPPPIMAADPQTPNAVRPASRRADGREGSALLGERGFF